MSSYIKYLSQRKNAHGLHSPYVFDFYNNVLKKAKLVNVNSAKKYMRECLNSDLRINRHDLGAGSKKLSQVSSVKQIAKTAGSTNKF